MEHGIKRLNRELIRRGAILNIYKDTMRLPNGEIEEWDYIEHRMEMCIRDRARIDRADMQYLYSDGDLFHFMDTTTYEQIALDADTIGDALKFVKENEMVKTCSYKGSVYAVEPPLFVELEITETEPGFKGDTAQGATKPAIVETGASVNVQMCIRDRYKTKNIKSIARRND